MPIIFIKLRTDIKINFEHRYLHALVKSTTAEGIELSSLSGRVRNLTIRKCRAIFASGQCDPYA